MKREEAIAILNTHQNQLTEFKVKSLTIFGSVARDEATLESDVDLLVEFEKPVGLVRLVGLKAS